LIVASCRTLAYSTLADLVHHSRDQLSPDQLSRVIYAYSCNAHISSVACSTQTLSVKLLNNLVDTVLVKFQTERTEGTRILMGLLESCVDKLGALVRIHEDLTKLLETSAQRPAQGGTSGASGTPNAETPSSGGWEDFSTFVMVERAKPVETTAHLIEHQEAVLRGYFSIASFDQAVS
jgi:transformation/transcription domain-associated protein